jgi:hypothetical protein
VASGPIESFENGEGCEEDWDFVWDGEYFSAGFGREDQLFGH